MLDTKELLAGVAVMIFILLGLHFFLRQFGVI